MLNYIKLNQLTHKYTDTHTHFPLTADLQNITVKIGLFPHCQLQLNFPLLGHQYFQKQGKVTCASQPQPRPHHSFSATITCWDVFETRKTTLALYLLTGSSINIPASQVPRNAQGSIPHQSLDLSSVNSFSFSPSVGILDSPHKGPVSGNDLKQQGLLNVPPIYLHSTHPHMHMQVSENETGQVLYSICAPDHIFSSKLQNHILSSIPYPLPLSSIITILFFPLVFFQLQDSSFSSLFIKTLKYTLSFFHPHSHTCPLQSGFYHTHSPRPPYLILLHWLAKSNGNPSAFKILKLIIKHQTGDTSLFQIPSSFKLTSPLFYFPGEEFHHLLKSYNKQGPNFTTAFFSYIPRPNNQNSLPILSLIQLLYLSFPLSSSGSYNFIFRL